MRESKGKRARRGHTVPFIMGWATYCCQVTVGRGKPGCSQVTVGVESSQNTEGLALCD